MKSDTDLRYFSDDEIRELKKYILKNKWEYNPAIPSRISICGIPKEYNPGGIKLTFGKYTKSIHRWQIVEFLAHGRVIHTKAECTLMYRPTEVEIIKHNRAKEEAIKTLRASMDSLESVFDREVVEDVKIQETPHRVPQSRPATDSISCLYFSSVHIEPSKNLIEIFFVEEETSRVAKVSSHHDRSVCALKDLPEGILGTNQRYEILRREMLEYINSHTGGEDSHWHFSGTVDNDGFLISIDGH